MDDRICGTCRHFEWATQPGRGWCRNPRLYTANQSQPVSEFELSCATRQGDFWEASDDFIDPSIHVAEPDSPVVRSLEYDEHEVLSGGGQMRGSSADQPRSSDDPASQQGDADCAARPGVRVVASEFRPRRTASAHRPRVVAPATVPWLSNRRALLDRLPAHRASDRRSPSALERLLVLGELVHRRDDRRHPDPSRRRQCHTPG